MVLVLVLVLVLKYQYHLTVFVPTALWRAVKKNGSARSRIAQRRKEEKRSRCFERTLLIKDFKYGPSFSILVQKNNEAQRSNISQFFVTIITRHVSSILARNPYSTWKQRAKITVQSVFCDILGRAKYSGRSLPKNSLQHNSC